jgi:hypothetical protein
VSIQGPTVIVAELRPGDVVEQAGQEGLPATFIIRTEHPIWPKLSLVVWKLWDGSWSFDALSDAQEVGQLSPSDHGTRQERLRNALYGRIPGRSA